MSFKEVISLFELSKKKPTHITYYRFIGTIFAIPFLIIKSFTDKRMLLFLLILLGSVILSYDFKKLKYNLNYKSTKWYKNTHHSPLDIISDKGIMGEYIATYCANYMLSKNNIYGKIFNSVVIPKKGTDFAEVDLIVVSEVGIHVIEVKNRIGIFKGAWNDKEWIQVAGNDENVSSNFILQNVSHINSMLIELYDEFKDMNYLPRVNLSSVINNIVVIANNNYSLDISENTPPERNYWVGSAIDYKNLKFREIDKMLTKEEVDKISEILSRHTGYTPQQMERFINQRAYSYENNSIDNKPTYGLAKDASNSRWLVYRTNGYETLYRSNLDGVYYADPDPRSVYAPYKENGKILEFPFEDHAIKKLKELERQY